MDPKISRFVEGFGLYFESSGASRSAGQILAWLLISEEPRSLDDLAEALHISKASASLGTRLWDLLGVLDRVHIPGDRKTYYRIRPDLGPAFVEASLKKFHTLAELCEVGMDAVGDDRPNARRVLARLARIYRHLLRRMPEILTELEELEEE